MGNDTSPSVSKNPLELARLAHWSPINDSLAPNCLLSAANFQAHTQILVFASVNYLAVIRQAQSLRLSSVCWRWENNNISLFSLWPQTCSKWVISSLL